MSPPKLRFQTRSYILNPSPLFQRTRSNSRPTKPVTANDNEYFLRGASNNGLGSVAFHCSVCRGLRRFLGLDGNLQVGYDLVNSVDAWNTLFVQNDPTNPFTGEIDPACPTSTFFDGTD